MSVFSYSFFASFHCAFMCGPLVCAGIGGSRATLWRASLYNAARLVSYLFVAILLYYSIGGLLQRYKNLSIFFSVTIGVIVVALALTILIGKDFKFLDKYIPTTFFTMLSRHQNSKNFPILLGLATGFLPCASLLPVYLIAAQSGSLAVAAGLVSSFFVGTLPIMVALPLLSKSFVESMRLKNFSRLAALFLLLAGVMTIWRAF